MVRVKHRYLLANILYPELDINTSATKAVPDVVTFHQPTSKTLSSRHIEKGIKAEVENLFGDYGYGAIKGSVQVKYLSTATSTFIVKVSRDHYRMVWAALSFMDTVPVKDGKKCVFRVVRVSGTIRKAQEETVRRAKELILTAQRQQNEKSDSTLSGIFGTNGSTATLQDATNDVFMVDGSDGENEDESDDS